MKNTQNISKKIVFFILATSLFIFSQKSQAQLNFLHGIVASSSCSQAIRNTCQSHLQAGCITSGKYFIRTVDVSVPVKQVYCDQVTSGGGWTVIIKSNLGTKEQVRDYLANFGPTTNIDSTIYNDAILGFGWGTNDRQYKAFNISKLNNYSEMYVIHSAYDNTPVNGLGWLTIGNRSYQGLVWDDPLPSGSVHRLMVNDGMGDPSARQTLYINTVAVATGDYTDRADILTGGYSALNWINFTGYTASSPYAKRYIRLMMVR